MIFLARISSTTLRRSAKNRYPSLIPDVEDKDSVFGHLGWVLP
jgi:hypothetical protein